MRKAMLFVVISLLLVATIWIGCSITKVKTTPITDYNVPILKGKWEGTATFGVVGKNIWVPTTMEIYNNSVPVKGKLTMHSVPPAVLDQFVPKPKTVSGDATIEFGDGNVNESGNLVAKQGENYFELKLTIGQKLRMDGWIHYASLNPSVTLNK